jgi:hypothetical protein
MEVENTQLTEMEVDVPADEYGLLLIDLFVPSTKSQRVQIC